MLNNSFKRIVICADGTWNKPDRSEKVRRHIENNKCLKPSWTRQPSNVVKLARAILPKASDGVNQVVYYDSGIGTNIGLYDKLFGGAFGVGLSQNILDCYRFLVHNYDDTDEIYLFGFSRGAFTVRSLAGFIQRCGLLAKENIYWTPEAYKIYRLPYYENESDVDSLIFRLMPEWVQSRMMEKYKRKSDKHKECVENFREINKVRDLKIKFLGVWDTVGSLGIPGIRGLLRKYRFHNVNLGSNIQYAYQALAIDEQRKPFKPSLWSAKGLSNQVLEQMWFAGVHKNIGGGYSPDGLANCAMHWLLDKAKFNGQGLEFNEDYLKYFEEHPESKLQNSMTWYYRLLGKYERPIGEQEGGFESVHPSVYERIKLKKEYEPKKIKEYLSLKKQP